MKFSSTIHAIVIPLAVIWSITASAQTADFIFTNGKIITVDDRFATMQALAIKSERIIAIGSDADIEKFKGLSTQLIDLQRRTVIPGLIDNHAHYMRAAEYWHREVRLDGVTSHHHPSRDRLTLAPDLALTAESVSALGPLTPNSGRHHASGGSPSNPL
jgi:imidazolonepropionase-like amidohydrolase